MMLARVMLCGLLALSLPAPAQERRLEPVDEASRDASWNGFKKRLLAAVQSRDKRVVLAIVDRNVRNQTTDGRGIAEFRRQWDLDAADSPFWRELSAALQLGGAYIKTEKGPAEFCTPYVMARWPADVDPYTHGAIVTREAFVQTEPSTASPGLATLSYDIVPVLDWDIADRAPEVKQRWVKVQIGHGETREGYVPEEHIRSPMEHAACFVRGTNGWRMTGFAPGGGE
jgi:hypothetical protein